MKMQAYNFTILHTNGTKNRVADAIANHPAEEAEPNEATNHVYALLTVGYSTEKTSNTSTKIQDDLLSISPAPRYQGRRN
jgi:Holliday junction resolvasome RuvABC DNA-binding subunit